MEEEKPMTDSTTGDLEPNKRTSAVTDITAREERAIEIGLCYGGIDGDHHKMWVIDQMLRALLGHDYEKAIIDNNAGEDGPNTYEWDEGIAP